jgi:hypothetical protein
VQLGPILVQLQPSLALQTLDYLKAVRDFDASAGVTSSSKVVPLKQVRQQCYPAAPAVCHNPPVACGVLNIIACFSTPAASVHTPLFALFTVFTSYSLPIYCQLCVFAPFTLQVVLDSFKRHKVPLSFALTTLLPLLDVSCPQLAVLAPLKRVPRLDGSQSQQQPPSIAVELVARLQKLHASVG